MNIALEYIKYRLNAKGRHGIHSPFVFDLVDKCLNIRVSKEDKRLLNDLCGKLKNDSNTIDVQDFGVGSKKLNSTRKIKQLYKTSSSKGKYGKLLYQLAKHYKTGSVLEFGTSIGIGTIHLALGNPNAQITTIEACPQTFNVAVKNFKAINSSSINFENKTFNEFLAQGLHLKYDLVFIDGHHDGKALMNYIEKLQSNFHDETIIILDDIRWSNSMFEAWQELVKSKQFNVTIDFFRMGILVPRSTQVKEHFVLKL